MEKTQSEILAIIDEKLEVLRANLNILSARPGQETHKMQMNVARFYASIAMLNELRADITGVSQY